jgi:subtilisin family serine protease
MGIRQPEAAERSRHLGRQIEKIADMASEPRFQVIVQMAPSKEIQQFVETSAEIMRRRRSIVSARALVPPHWESKEMAGKGKLPVKAKPSVGPSDDKHRVSYRATNLTLPPAQEGRAALTPLLTSRFGTSARGNKGKAGRRSAPQVFWTARAAVFEVSKDDLAAVPTELPMVTDIYPNRRLRVPPVTRANLDRAAIADYKGYTWGLARMGALGCWGVFDARGKGVKVAILDTGVDPTHPDLKGKIDGFAEFAEDGSVLINNKLKAYDSDKHGTHCAATVVGGNASGRWIGVAPEAQVLAGLVLKKGEGTDAQVLAGIEWAIQKGAHVISLSLGGLRMSADVLDLYTRSIINANALGIPVVVAVGNEGSQTTGAPGNDYFAFTVGATDVEDRAAGFSGGRTQIIEDSRYIASEHLPVVYSKPDVSAPGVDVFSAIPGGGHDAWNGTSMATPHVAGAMALLLSEPSTIAQLQGIQRVDVLQNLLISTVKELGESGQNHRFGYGRIDALRAMGYAQELGYF